MVLLGIRTALKDDLHCTAAELVYGVSLRLPGEFFSPSSPTLLPEDGYITRLKQFMSTLRATPPRPPNNRPSFVADALASASHVFFRRDSVKKSLQLPYDGPFRVISCTDKHFIVDINGRQDTVSIDRLKVAHVDYSNVTLPSSTLSSDAPPAITPTTVRTRSGRQVRFPNRLNL